MFLFGIGDAPICDGVPGWKCNPASSVGNEPTDCGVPGPGLEEYDDVLTDPMPTGLA